MIALLGSDDDEVVEGSSWFCVESDDEGERVLDRCWKLGEEKVQSRMGLSTCVHSGEAEMGISSREAPDDDVVNLVVVAESEEEEREEGSKGFGKLLFHPLGFKSCSDVDGWAGDEAVEVVVGV